MQHLTNLWQYVGPQNGRQIAAANGRNPLASPPAVATTGRLRDSSVRRYVVQSARHGV